MNKSISPLNEAMSQLLTGINILRGTTNPIWFALLNLYLLIIKKEGILQKVDIKSSDLKSDFRNKINEIKEKRLVVLKEIFFELEPLLVGIYDEQLKEVFDNIATLNETEFQNNFSNIFDTCLYILADSQGKMGGVFYQPKELTDLMNYFIPRKNNVSIYNPFAGYASFALNLPKDTNYFGQELTRSTWAIGQLRLLANDCSENIVLKVEDSIKNWNPKNCKYDFIIGSPPLNARFSNNRNQIQPSHQRLMDSFFIEQSVKSLTKDGKAVIAAPLRFLFSVGAEKELRKNLVSNNILEYVITLPSGILKHTGIPLCLIVLNKSKKDIGFVKMINASDYLLSRKSRNKILDFNKIIKLIKDNKENKCFNLVPNHDIEKADYSLNFGHYFYKNYKGIKLLNLVKNTLGKRVEKNTIGKFVRIRNLKDSSLDFKLDYNTIEEDVLPSHARLKIEESCILVAMRWKTIKPTFFEYKDVPIYISNDILALKIDESKVNIHYLIDELNSNEILKQIESFRMGATIPMIRKKDLFEIKIELPSIEEQVGKVKGLIKLSEKIKILERERNALVHGKNLEEFDEFRSLKHSLGAPRQNILSNAKSLIRFFENNNSEAFTVVKDAFKNRYGTELKNIFEQIRDNIDHISIILEKGEGGLVLNNYQKEIVPLKEINNILKNYSSKGYKFNINYKPLIKVEIARNGLECNTTLFKILLENIFTNADKYGFQEKTSDNAVAIELKVIDDFLEVIIKNNGTPFPKNFYKNKFITKFSTVDSNNGSGLGGYDINRIAKYFGDKDWQLILNKESLYPVEFKFNFPLIMIENGK